MFTSLAASEPYFDLTLLIKSFRIVSLYFEISDGSEPSIVCIVCIACNNLTVFVSFKNVANSNTEPVWSFLSVNLAILATIGLISKELPNNIFIFRDDNYSGLQPHFIKNGVIAKANTIGNPSYDLQNKKLRNLNIGKDVILSVRLFEGVNESIMTEGVWSKIMAGVRKGSQSGPWTIVIIQNKKVIHQEPVKVKDAIPASYEAMKRKFRNAVLSIEDKQGQIVYSERI